MSRSKLLLYGSASSSAARRVRAVLIYKNIEFEEIMIDIAKGDAKYKALVNPMGMVPAVKFPQSDSVLFESLPIMELINELYREKPILPKDPYELARCRQITEIVNSGMFQKPSIFKV
ncbi:unnamed protein product [Oikopleura dioica]|uniref:GST N-terminal domain-containing protein n=2 Tax=Oikopleura dioica TaxID=34765 RepID=E4YK81_OIKDI|nr:unnamed protein product [Oikopleura dioica]